MLTEDYLMRMINQAVAALVTVVGLKKKQQFNQAGQAIEQALEQLTGLPMSVFRMLEDDRLFELLTTNSHLDTERLNLIADLLGEEGDISLAQKQPDKSRVAYTRSLNSYLEAAFAQQTTDFQSLGSKIDRRVQSLRESPVPVDVVMRLADFYELAGRFSQAERLWQEMASAPNADAHLKTDLSEFYARLAEQTDEALRAGGLTRAHVNERLAASPPPPPPGPKDPGELNLL